MSKGKKGKVDRSNVIFPLTFEVIGKNIKLGNREGNFGKEIKI